jgi:hypothetical protein
VTGKIYYSSGAGILIDSSNCGTFFYDGDLAAYKKIKNGGDRYDFETRGFVFNFPPMARIVRLEYVGPAKF